MNTMRAVYSQVNIDAHVWAMNIIFGSIGGL